ncbi:hypothetical protein BBJ28_00016416 [Nothophytophthora sp. Chile5]|nr:hypothetical protein BBJ28_00016416 [Nothophytophthora sp. Chile5]
MAGLPNSQMLDRLATDLYAKTDRITNDLDATAGRLTHDLRLKADRAEIDRLQSLLEANDSSNAPHAYLTKSPLRCLSCDQHLPFAQAPADSDTPPEVPGSPTAYRSESPPSSPHHHIVYRNHQPQQPQLQPYQQDATYTQATRFYNDLGVDRGLLEELFAASTSGLERRRRQRQRLQLELASSQMSFASTLSHDSDWAARKSGFLNLDDGRNRIPLRKTLLSDQVIYGPAITPNAFRRKPLALAEESVGRRHYACLSRVRVSLLTASPLCCCL